MKRSNEEEAKRWLQQAKRDLDDAIFSKDGQRYNLACFLSQQAAEKAIKAYLYSQGAEFVWGHSVAELINDAIQFDESFVGRKKEGSSLDKYYIPTRYQG
ncbi:HEPN domain-containing protein [Thermoanaerobacter uzonensis DSM 18761]|uniref:HEPN domain-containing protein n=1 Tax=Thermoanaerobacter uzonensis DSM 18761 TaxID=1123369 RepID=A0A1M4SG14_9THEO|nr:HEPN domain-containing protein [Thermoanaerobacter uzonensis]SHE31140.1 HEPN domain-containing protein [Thermoanaerobacter uzonensis DSM 18761]